MEAPKSKKQMMYWKEASRRYPNIPPYDSMLSNERDLKINAPEERSETRALSTFIENIHSSLEGAAMTNSNVMILEHHNILLRKDHLMMDNKVKLVTGGRAGHEPLYTSYVGPGMLTAAIVGTGAHPPSSRDIYLCLKELSHNHCAGIIAIVPNSFEDVINFGLGIEKARCNGILVDLVTIGDDCWESGKVRFGRRCLAGITLAFKIAGAMAEEKKNMKEIYITLRKLNIGTISCRISDSVSIGTDLNGENGMCLTTVNMCEVFSKMLDYLIDQKKYFSLPTDLSSSYLLMINSYTNERLFLYQSVKEILEQLSDREVNVIRVYAGTFVSGQRGLSISLLNTEGEVKILRYADSACSCHFWPRVEARGVPLIVKGPSLPTGNVPLLPIGPFMEKKEFIDVPLIFACKALLSSQHILNNLDDNDDFGSSIVPAVETIMKHYNEYEFPKLHPYNLLNVIGYICQDYIANIHGTFLYIFFHGAAQAFLSYSREVNVTHKMWVKALIRGVDALESYTQFKENDFTILTVLAPFTDTLKFHLKHQMEDVELMLQDAITITSALMENTIDEVRAGKMKGKPEVSGQATLLCLTAVVEGIVYVIHKNGNTDNEESDGSNDS